MTTNEASSLIKQCNCAGCTEFWLYIQCCMLLSGATTHFDPVMLFGYFYLSFQYKWPHLDFFSETLIFTADSVSPYQILVVLGLTAI